MSISSGLFKRILRELNPSLKVFEARSTRSSMIYFANGNHYLAGESGLREICGYPSPCHFYSFPKYDFIDHEGMLNRGYTTVFKILCLKKLIDRAKLRKLLPHALDPHHFRPEVPVHEDPETKDFVPVHGFRSDQLHKPKQIMVRSQSRTR